MDPYLERRWRDVHTVLVVEAREALNRLLPPDLVARTEDRVYVESEAGLSRAIHPDVRVSEQIPIEVETAAQSNVAVAEPVILEIDSEPVTEPFIQILEADGERVVTGIEFVSPANKQPGDKGRKAYLKKRREFLSSRSNLVEIDLTRAGNWRSLVKPLVIPQTYWTDYRVLVRRAWERSKVELYPITLRQHLPKVSIPLRQDDPEVPLNLQELVDRAYVTGRYGSIDYSRPCDPPLNPEDTAWLDGLLKQRGQR